MPSITTTGKYLSLVDYWQRLRTRSQEAVFTLQHYPSPGNDQLMSTPGNTGVSAKESGSVELYAAASHLMLDAQLEAGRLSTPKVLTLQSKTVRLTFENLVANGNKINPELLRPKENNKDTNQLVSPNARFFDAITLNTPIVTGLPVTERGQNSIPFGSLFGLTTLVTEPLPVTVTSFVDEALARTDKFFTE